MSNDHTPQNMQPPPDFSGRSPFPMPDLSRLRAEFAADAEDNEDEDEDNYEYDDYEDEENEPDYDGHPSWYEPRQCDHCNGFYMGREVDSGLCDSCEVKHKKQIQEMLDDTIHD